MEPLWRWLYRRFGAGYLLAYVIFAAVAAFLITLGTFGIFSLYQEHSKEEFLRVWLVTDTFVMLSLGAALLRLRREVEPIVAWIRGRRGERSSIEAWRCAIALPLRFVTRGSWQPALFVALPGSLYATWELELPFYSAPVIFAGGMVAIVYAAILQFFYSEVALRPVVADISRHLPSDFPADRAGVPLRWKLLGALPLINVFTGVVVSGLSTDGRASLEDLGFDVIVAVLVAFTVSFELTLLVTKSVLRPVRDLLEATRRVKAGDLSARVPVTSGDEMGALAGSFNEMVSGLAEREALREAFGSYVDPNVAERVLEEGEMLEGDEVEVTVAFIDIRDFTAYAENASAAETVAYLNDFFELVVPILVKHGGHANKFIGDGVLGVFGAPKRQPDHADRALRAACEIARTLRERNGDELRIGIGINSGPVVAGTVGGGGRLDFTVIGDPVNVASRVEALSEETGDVIALTEATRCLLTGGETELEPRGEIALKGKSEPVPIYGVAGLLRDGARPIPERARGVASPPA
jgi:adenylate cyclase